MLTVERLLQSPTQKDNVRRETHQEKLLQECDTLLRSANRIITSLKEKHSSDSVFNPNQELSSEDYQKWDEARRSVEQAHRHIISIEVSHKFSSSKTWEDPVRLAEIHLANFQIESLRRDHTNSLTRKALTEEYVAKVADSAIQQDLTQRLNKNVAFFAVLH